MNTHYFRIGIVVILLLIIIFIIARFGIKYKNNLARNSATLNDNNLIVVSDQGTKRLLVLDSKEADWNTDSAVKWSWHPTASNGFSDDDKINGWRLPSDVRLRNSKFFGGQVILTCDSDGLLAIIPYPAGNVRLWSKNLGISTNTTNNPHAMELLPDGNVAVAASNGGWVRIYTSSQGVDSTNYVQYDLKQAHGVLWDPVKKLLWALGDDYLTALKISGTASKPIVEEDKSLRLKLPSVGGHDLQPVYGNADRLWVTTNLRVFQYVKSKKSWDMDYTGNKIKGNMGIDREGIKSVGNHPSGLTVMEVKANYVVYSWCTDTIDFIHTGTPLTHEAKTKNSMAIYKARYMNPNYQ